MMKKTELNKIVKKIHAIGRPLEIARLNHVIADGSIDDILLELSAYQNDDGGFGHALEPDLWNPNSSPIQSWVATTIFREIQIDKNHIMVQKLLNYFESSFDESCHRWPRLDPSNDAFPHAPWWGYRIEDPDFNPSASIAGFIYQHADPSSQVYAYAHLVINDAMAFVNHTKDPIEMHELRALIDLGNDLLEMMKDKPVFEKYKKKLIEHMERAIEPDEHVWFSSYCVKPSSLIKTHPSIGSDVFQDLMEKEFHQALKHRNHVGLWSLTWSWTHFIEQFKKASEMWMGIIAFDYVYLMKCYHLIES